MPVRSPHWTGAVRRVLSEPLATSSDAELLERFLASEQPAFAALLDRHGPMVLRLCRRLVRADLAEDVFQATFLVLARKGHTLRKRNSLSCWLYGVATRLARRARLAESAYRRRELRAGEERRRTSAADGAREDLLGLLDEELRRLPEEWRAPLLLCYLEGRTQDEAAAQLGWSLSTLRRRLERGRELLRARMTRRGASLPAGLLATALTPPVAVPVSLREATLALPLADAAGAAIPAPVAALAAPAPVLAKLFACLSVLALAVGALTATALPHARQATPEHVSLAAPEEPDAEPAPPPVPLPRGAVARLGTLAFRHGRIVWGGFLTFTPDGKHLVSAGGGWVRRWDARTGQALVNIGDGWRDGNAGTNLATADGRRAFVGTNVPTGNGGSEWMLAEHDLRTGKKLPTSRLEFPPNTRSPHALPGFLSPDGKFLVELGHLPSGGLTLWADRGAFLRYLRPARGGYTALAFPPDGKHVLAGADDHNFDLIELKTGARLRSFGIAAADNRVGRMAVSPDGKWLVTAGGRKAPNPSIWPHDNFVRLWDLKTAKVVRKIDFPEDGGVESLLFTPDSRTLLVASRGGDKGARAAVRSWDVATGKAGRAWTDDAAIGLTIAVSPDGRSLATLSADGVIRLWDMRTGKEKSPPAASPCGIEAVCFRPDGKFVRTMGANQAMHEWDATGQLAGSRKPIGKGFQPAFSPGGKYVLLHFWKPNDSNTFRLHDSASGKLVLDREGSWPVFSADDRLLAFIDKASRVVVLDLATGKAIQTLMPHHKAGASYPVPRGFTGRRLILQGEHLSAWDVQTGKQLTSWSLIDAGVLPKQPPSSQSWERVEAVAVSADGKTVAFSLLKDLPQRRGFRAWFGRVMVFATTGKLLHQFDLAGTAPERLAFSPDGKSLAGSDAWTVHVWDLTSGKKTHTLDGHRGRITSLAFRADGKLLASASQDSTVLIWDLSRR
jgi:RNA polymerase sigma factor (sigma-70 family)